ncbi:30S ribosomal protein S11 [Platysternon megacephalum]|uniref:30S ribosomal protein S11 n=1 Tax=Platysternon megacephalum TaxID=55544 RepID=A0A4D9DJB7_9SAUR|nr:30S ribosomal protein S11 [Platysternon megacephalum]
MAMRGPRPLLLLPLVQLTACLALASGQSCIPEFRTFWKNHVDYLRTSFSRHNTYCRMRMERAKLYKKPINTFIHIPIEAIKSVCRVNGIPVPPDLRKSKRFFKVTTCRYNKTHNKTHLYNGTFYRRQIVIRCCYAFPIYYHE